MTNLRGCEQVGLPRGSLVVLCGALPRFISYLSISCVRLRTSSDQSLHTGLSIGAGERSPVPVAQHTLLDLQSSQEVPTAHGLGLIHPLLGVFPQDPCVNSLAALCGRWWFSRLLLCAAGIHVAHARVANIGATPEEVRRICRRVWSAFTQVVDTTSSSTRPVRPHSDALAFGHLQATRAARHPVVVLRSFVLVFWCRTKR